MTLHDLPATMPRRARLTIDDFLLLDRSGAFADHAKTELLDGEILVVNARHRPHMFVKSKLAYRLRCAFEAAGSTLFVGTEGSVALSPNDLPEPDIVVTSEPLGEGPVPVDSVALIVEVAQTTLALDMGTKRKLMRAPVFPNTGWPMCRAKPCIRCGARMATTSPTTTDTVRSIVRGGHAVGADDRKRQPLRRHRTDQ